MSKTYFALLAVVVLAAASVSSFSQSIDNVTIKAAVVGKDLSLKSVPKHSLTVRSTSDTSFAERRLTTSFEGVASLSLPAGTYIIMSAAPLSFDEKSFSWSVPFTVGSANVSIELSNDNAKIDEIATASAPKRRVSEAAELFRTHRDGVVTVEGDLSTGTGFIFDDRGLVLTNFRVISETTDIRVRFDKNTAVKARVLAKDIEKDLAILQVNMEAFPASKVLKLAAPSSEGTVFEGEHVFAIGSPAHQEKMLMTGIVSKLQDSAIIADLNFNEGSAGSPLFNSLGEVVGITTFKVSDKEGAGLSGIVRVEEVKFLIQEAQALASTKGLPSAQLMPSAPDGKFPVETIKTTIKSKDFASSQYMIDVKNYQLKYMTPVYKFYEIEKDRIESLKIREKRNSKKGFVDLGDMFRDLSVWDQYAGELQPVVQILALPETTPTGKSMAMAAITNLTIGYTTPLDHKYKADFAQMKLLCDGQEVIPIRRNKTEIARDLQSYYKTKKRYTYAGVYTYPYDIFGPGRCSQMQLHVFSEENIEEPIISTVTEAVKTRIWTDFADFRNQSAKKQ